MAAGSTLARYEDPLDVRERSANGGFFAGYAGNTRVNKVVEEESIFGRGQGLRNVVAGLVS